MKRLPVCDVTTQVTLALQPLFKRSVTFTERDDRDLEEQVAKFGYQHEFADIAWFPGHGRAVYRVDDRLPLSAPGEGVLDFIGFRATPTLGIQANRLAEDLLERDGDGAGKCAASRPGTGCGGATARSPGTPCWGRSIGGLPASTSSTLGAGDAERAAAAPTACPRPPPRAAAVPTAALLPARATAASTREPLLQRLLLSARGGRGRAATAVLHALPGLRSRRIHRRGTAYFSTTTFCHSLNEILV